MRTAAGYLEKDTKLPKTTIQTTLMGNFNIGHRSTVREDFSEFFELKKNFDFFKN